MDIVGTRMISRFSQRLASFQIPHSPPSVALPRLSKYTPIQDACQYDFPSLPREVDAGLTSVAGERGQLEQKSGLAHAARPGQDERDTPAFAQSVDHRVAQFGAAFEQTFARQGDRVVLMDRGLVFSINDPPTPDAATSSWPAAPTRFSRPDAPHSRLVTIAGVPS